MLSIIQAAGWPVWPLILCSILALALIFERLYQLQTAKVIPPHTLEQAMDATRRGPPTEEAIVKLESCLQKNPQASAQDLTGSMEMAGRLAAGQLERYLSALATIASAAPLLGLLGTVIGMIEIFGSSSVSGNQPAQLAHGISIALYNTAFGLIVAIPALMFWRYFRSLVDNQLLSMEVACEQFARHLNHLRF